MTLTSFLYRPVGLGLSLMALSVTGGCAHLREGAQRAARAEREQAPAPRPTPALVAAAPVAAPPVTARSLAKPVNDRPKVSHRAPPIAPKVNSLAREAVLDAPISPTLAPSAPPTAAPPAAMVAATAVIVFANTPGANCGACETLKVSVAPSGRILIERSHSAGDNREWQYKRSIANVGPAGAAAFAARLSAYRPAGAPVPTSDADCASAATLDDGLVIEWIEAGRHDQLAVNFRCPAQRNSPLADILRHAPDALGLRQLVFPWR